ncbi:hypothetical protein [Nakamurella endophytica]|nr:hypothetical protein [Nakamurella endophytica]
MAAVLTVLAALVAAVVVAFLPLRAGAVPLPISVILAAATVVVLPRWCLALTGSLLMAAAPVVAWFAVTAWTALQRNPLYPQVTLAVGDWRLVLLMLLGGAGGAAAVTSAWGARVRAAAAGPAPSGFPGAGPAVDTGDAGARGGPTESVPPGSRAGTDPLPGETP